MTISWKPAWYGLDQTIIVGDIDFFYLSNKGDVFANDEAADDNKKVYGEVRRITHLELGEVHGIFTEGLYYRVFVDEETFIQIDAEENVGEVEYPPDCSVRNWNFEIELRIDKIPASCKNR